MAGEQLDNADAVKGEVTQALLEATICLDDNEDGDVFCACASDPKTLIMPHGHRQASNDSFKKALVCAPDENMGQNTVDGRCGFLFVFCT